MASEVLNARLKQYLEAENAILIGGQSYTIGNRTLTRANLAEIRDAISDLISAGATVDSSGKVKPRRARIILVDD